MNRFTSFRLAAVLSVLALLPWAGSARADGDRDDKDQIKKVHGRIVEIHPDQHRLTVRTHRDKDMTFDVDDHALLEMNGKEVPLGEFKEGERVKIRYEAKDGKQRALSVRAPQAGEALRRKFRDALETAKDFGAEQKQQFQQKLQSALNQLDDQIDELKEKAAAARGPAKEQYEKTIRDLERQRDEAQRKLDRVKAASGAAWEDIKGGMSSAVNDLQKAIDRARNHFKD